jgi:hypothetical protein
MKNEKRKKLEQAGWQVGSAPEFLGLSAAEEAFIELKLALAKSLFHQRTARALTQAGAARLLGSSQSRFAKMEAADATVSCDLLIRALLDLGATPAALARAIAHPAALSEEPARYVTKARRKKKP